MGTIDPDKIKFKTLYTASVIEARVSAMGEQISADLNGEPVIIIAVLRGAFIFAADLVRHIKAPVSIDFIGASSYQGTTSTGSVRVTHDVTVDINGRNVIVVEDIVDTGRTLDFLLAMLRQRGPKSLKLCTLLSKPEAREVAVDVDYCGFEISKEFVIGYGLDLNGRWRELPYIAQVET
ncbi:MAG: hypoxanthine phosphoribosyltransferase [Proteobacteria bacterium]|nr:hypoxanthine phosphoribosyltransferase [Pseudomonadota bacterium]